MSPGGLPRNPPSSFATLRLRSAAAIDSRRPGRQQRDAVGEQLGEHAARAQHQDLTELRIDDQADQDFRNPVGDHLLDQDRVGEDAQPLRGGLRRRRRS